MRRVTHFTENDFLNAFLKYKYDHGVMNILYKYEAALAENRELRGKVFDFTQEMEDIRDDLDQIVAGAG